MTFRNRAALALWLFALLVLAVLLAISVVLIRDGGSKVYSDELLLGVMAVGWTGGLLLLAYVSTKPCYRLVFRPDATVSLTRHYPFRRNVRNLPVAELKLARVVDSRDADGAAYFYCRVELPDGVSVDLAEGRHRKHCAVIAARFNQSIWSALDAARQASPESAG